MCSHGSSGLAELVVNSSVKKRHNISTDVYSASRGSSAIAEPLVPERDYVTFGSLLSPIRLSSVTLVLLRRLNISAIFLHRCVRWPSSELHAKFYGDRSRGTPPSEALNARGVAKYSDFGPIEGYIS